MKYMLDTNICIYIIKNKPCNLLKKILENDSFEMCVSSITYAEMTHGIENSSEIEKNRFACVAFLSAISILDFGLRAAEEYGRIRANLERKGTLLGPMDLMIASHAIAEDLTLVTSNPDTYENVDGLKFENWLNEK